MPPSFGRPSCLLFVSCYLFPELFPHMKFFYFSSSSHIAPLISQGSRRWAIRTRTGSLDRCWISLFEVHLGRPLYQVLQAQAETRMKIKCASTGSYKKKDEMEVPQDKLIRAFNASSTFKAAPAVG